MGRCHSEPEAKNRLFISRAKARCFALLSMTSSNLGVCDTVGAERFVFATDYNHSDSKFPHTVDEVMERKDLSDGLKTKLMGENAARLYNL